MKLRAVLLSAVIAAASATAGAADAPYKVTDGNKVDANTRKGFETWRGAACERCHGPNQEGMVGPSLIESLKTMSKQDFAKAVTEGAAGERHAEFRRQQAGHGQLDNLYAYLKCRSDGACKSAKVQLAE